MSEIASPSNLPSARLHEVSDVLWTTGKPSVQVAGTVTVKTWHLNQVGVLTVVARPGAGAQFNDSVQLYGFEFEYNATQREYYLIPTEYLIKPMSTELQSAFRHASVMLRWFWMPFCSLIFGLLPTCFLTLALFNKHSNLDTTVLLGATVIWFISSVSIAFFLYPKWWHPFEGYDRNTKDPKPSILLPKEMFTSSPSVQSFEAVWLIESVVLTKCPNGVGFKNPSSTGRADGLGGTRIGQHQPLIKVMPERNIAGGIAKHFDAVRFRA